MAQSRGLRVVRGTIVASIATFIALMSHVAAGGALPALLGIAVPWVLSVMVCTLLTGRSLSLARLSLGVVLSQTLYHLLFVLGTPSSSRATAVHMHGHVQTLSGEPAFVESMMHGGAAMWVSHAVAAIVTIAVVYRGETAARRLGALARDLLSAVRRRLIVPAFAAPTPRPVPVVASELRALPSLGRHADSVARRGPPSLLLV
ncbi:hypothetical protein ACFQZV_08005 [Microbacterium koreense]|uniref:Integral membrane protein n=1 Tax=Microbacterium koreense TaxID=323761 RepID=A0ABW2ZRH2_9MICO